jgi:uncharacterized protein
MKKYLYIFLFLSIPYCASGYNKTISEIESSFYKEDFDSAIPKIRSLAESSSDTDKLLYLLEAGILFHTKGDFETSNKVFKQAEEFTDSQKVSATGETLSFIINDTYSKFLGESFEKVLIKQYLAMNYLMLRDVPNAKRYFKKLDFELREMKVNDSKFKQNLFARYLDAIVSEEVGNYNDARVSYKNISEINPDNKEILADRYVLAVKEGDTRDQQKFAEGKSYINAYNSSLSQIEYNPNLAEVVILNEAGKSATKESRGKLVSEPIIHQALLKSVEIALRSNAQEGLTATTVMTTVGLFAENPIPKYSKREENSSLPVEVLINNKTIGKTKIYNDYSDIAISNFEENYNVMVTKHIATIATKLVASIAATETAAKALSNRDNKKNDAVVELVVRLIGGIITAATVSNLIEPDLRCWRTLPSNFQIKRIFIEPGTYSFEFKSPSARTLGDKNFKNITVEKGKTTYINFRSL